MFNFFFLGGNTAISAQVQEICGWYAKKHSLALPLSPEQLLNAVAEYAQMATDPHIFFGDADPEYDYRVGDLRFSADWNVYQYTNTGWVLIGNTQGPKGDTGEQGPHGPAGPKGDTGASYLFYGNKKVVSSAPSVGGTVALTAGYFNRTPTIGEQFLYVAQTTSQPTTTYIVVAQVSAASGANYTCATLDFSDITGGESGGGAGLVQRYMHNITYYNTGEVLIKLAIFSDDSEPYSDLNSLIPFFRNNMCDSPDRSYPATGYYISKGAAIWGIFLDESVIGYCIQFGDNFDGYGLAITEAEFTDIVVDLGS